MKTTKIIFAKLIALSFILFSCDTSGPDEIKPIQFDREVKFRSTVHFYQQPTNYNLDRVTELINTKYVTRGRSNAKDLYSFGLEMTHEAILINFGEAVRIQNGELRLRGQDGHEIHGEYEGYGYFSKNPKDLTLIIRIVGGTGYYAGASGHLKGYCMEGLWEPDVREMILEGIIVKGNLIVS